MCDFAHSWITQQLILVRGPLCRETQITLKPCISPYFSLSCCMGMRPRSVTWLRLWRTKRIGALSGHVALVSRKRHFLCIMRNFGFLIMRILVGRTLHRSKESSLKMSYLGCFIFSFCQAYMMNEIRHYNAGRTALNMFHGQYSTQDQVEHILDNSYFCVRRTLFPVHNMN